MPTQQCPPKFMLTVKKALLSGLHTFRQHKNDFKEHCKVFFVFAIKHTLRTYPAIYLYTQVMFPSSTTLPSSSTYHQPNTNIFYARGKIIC